MSGGQRRLNAPDTSDHRGLVQTRLVERGWAERGGRSGQFSPCAQPRVRLLCAAATCWPDDTPHQLPEAPSRPVAGTPMRSMQCLLGTRSGRVSAGYFIPMSSASTSPQQAALSRRACAGAPPRKLRESVVPVPCPSPPRASPAQNTAPASHSQRKPKSLGGSKGPGPPAESQSALPPAFPSSSLCFFIYSKNYQVA